MDDLELAQRTDALRALARGLLRDPDEAEDVVQEAWAASLEARPRDLLSWLRGATRRLAARTMRSRVRRRRREQAAARPEAVPADAAAEADVLRALAAELARLEEPYRTVLVLRYYRDLRPPEIAASLSVPVATVKTRLRRGLAILRARLAREHRSWALVLAPLAARPLRLGVVLAVAGTLCAAVLVLVRSGPGSAPETSRPEPTLAARPAEVAAATAGGTQEPARPRAEVLVEGPDGPVADAQVTIAPLDLGWETTAARTDASGLARFDPPAEGPYEVKADARGLVVGGVFARFPGTARVRLRAGCGLKLRLNPWPDPAWAALRWSALGPGRARELAFDAAEIDAGVWPAGVVSISCYAVGGGETRSVHVALPEGGEVVHELQPPAAKTTEIEVVDADSGLPVHEWTAWGIDPGLAPGAFTDEGVRGLPRESGTPFGVYRVPATGPMWIDAAGYARAFLAPPRDGDRPVRVPVRRGATLRLSFPPETRVSEIRVYYNAPARSGISRSSHFIGGPLPSGQELNLTDPSVDPASFVRRVAGKDGWTASMLPSESLLDIVGLDEAGLCAFRQVETGPPGSEASVELQWPPTVRHCFLVRDDDGRPVPGAEVRVLDTRGRGTSLGAVRTDASGRASVRGFRTDASYAVELLHRGRIARHDLVLSGPDGETVLEASERQTVPRRVLVLDEADRPVAGARVQFGAREGFGSFELTGEDGIAVGNLQPGEQLRLVGVSLEPDGGGAFETMMNPPADDPIVYRGDLGRVRVLLEIEGQGLVHAKLTGGKRDQDLKVHVHGHGTASFQLRVEPGEYRVEATLEGRRIERALVVRSGEPAVVPLRFER